MAEEKNSKDEKPNHEKPEISLDDKKYQNC